VKRDLEDMLDLKIGDLPITVRASVSLEKAGITTVRKAVQFISAEGFYGLSELDAVGRKAAGELMEVLIRKMFVQHLLFGEKES
jgi:orotidine-5'-phosphate decarboxylase